MDHGTGTVVEHSFTERMIGAAKLEIWAYEEVEADETATGQASLVVVMVAFAQAVGAAGEGSRSIVIAVVAAIVGWLVWSGVTYVIGTKMFDGTATWGELLRTIGFAQAPGLLSVLAVVPLLGWLVNLVVSLWILVTGIVAIRQALDFGTGRAVATAVIGWLAILIPRMVLAGVWEILS